MITATPAINTLSLHDALPILERRRADRMRRRSWARRRLRRDQADVRRRAVARPRHRTPAPRCAGERGAPPRHPPRSEEHTSELQSRFDLVCRLLLEKKKPQTRSRACTRIEFQVITCVLVIPARRHPTCLFVYDVAFLRFQKRRWAPRVALIDCFAEG